MESDDLEWNMEPGRCGICGKKHSSHICQRCWERWSEPDPERPGRRKLPDWVRFLKQWGDTESKRRRRNAQRRDSPPSRIATGKRGRPRQPGAVLVSFSAAGLDKDGESVYRDAADV